MNETENNDQNNAVKKPRRKHDVGGILFGLLLFLFFRIDSWLCSLPAWITLILHFVIGLSIWWFWATLAVWILAGVFRYLFIVFARWGGNSEDPPKKNINPYSKHNNDYYDQNN